MTGYDKELYSCKTFFKWLVSSKNKKTLSKTSVTKISVAIFVEDNLYAALFIYHHAFAIN